MIRDIGQYRILSCDSDEGCNIMKRFQKSLDSKTPTREESRGWFFLKDGRHFCPNHFPPQGTDWKRRMW